MTIRELLEFITNVFEVMIFLVRSAWDWFLGLNVFVAAACVLVVVFFAWFWNKTAKRRGIWRIR